MYTRHESDFFPHYLKSLLKVLLYTGLFSTVGSLVIGLIAVSILWPLGLQDWIVQLLLGQEM